jgi:hypothetical protein
MSDDENLLVSPSRLPDWQPRPHSLSAADAARLMQRLRQELVSLGHSSSRLMIVPPHAGQRFAGTTQPGYNFSTVSLRGMASGDALIPNLHVRMQETFPQLTRLFFSIHESFHAADTLLNVSMERLGSRYPELQDRLRTLSAAPTREGFKNRQDFFRSLSKEQSDFMMHTLERFGDTAAAVYLLNHVRDPQAMEFLGELRELREALTGHDPLHATSVTLTMAVQGYLEEVRLGRFQPGTMTMRQAAEFAQRFIATSLDPAPPAPTTTTSDTPTSPPPGTPRL